MSGAATDAKADLERFADAVEAIYAAAPNPDRWPDALQAIADCLGDVGAVLIWRRDDGGFGTIVSPSLEAPQAEYQRYWWQHDIRAARAAERSWVQGDIVTDRDIVTDAEAATHPFYTEFLARHGLRWVASVGVSPDPHVVVAISVQRGPDKPYFSSFELRTLERLGRHVEGALRLSVRLLDAELVKTGLGEALGKLNIGVLALDSLGRVTFSNPAADRMVGDGFSLSRGRLRIASPEAQAALDAMIDDRGGTFALLDPSPTLVRRVHLDRPLTVYLLPIPMNSTPGGHFLTQARVIVLAIDPRTEGPPDPALVRDVLGITLGEARLAALVGSGSSPRDAAARLGITDETARTVLKRVFSKLGISRQSELSVLMTKLMLR